MFAVLAGKMEVVKTIDGIERRLGWRVPGTIFGEVPLALGTPFPGGYRASEPSRVMRVDMRQYYTIAATAPEFSMKMGALARERLGDCRALPLNRPKRVSPSSGPVGAPSAATCDASSTETKSVSSGWHSMRRICRRHGRAPRPSPKTARYCDWRTERW